MEKTKIGILIADYDEYVDFEKAFSDLGAKKVNGFFKKEQLLLKNDMEISAVCSGMGKVNAATAATYLALKGVKLIINYGYSGGVSNISKGEVMICESFLEHDFDLTAIGYKPLEKPDQEYIYYTDKKILKFCRNLFGNIPFGRAVCGDSFISDNTKKDYLKEKLSAMSCDMESAAIASAAKLFKVPFISIREISDNAGDDAAATYRNTLCSQKMSMLDMVFKIIDNFKEL